MIIGEQFTTNAINYMKTNQQVVDAWIGRQHADGAHIFTDGTTIYSYGYHFPIATILPNGKVLYNTTRYSNTTAKHQSLVRWAIRDRVCVRCHCISRHDNEVRTKLAIGELLEKIPRCRKLGDRTLDVKLEIDKYESYCEAMEDKIPSWVYNIKFALNNLKGKSLRTWAKTYRL